MTAGTFVVLMSLMPPFDGNAITDNKANGLWLKPWSWAERAVARDVGQAPRGTQPKTFDQLFKEFRMEFPWIRHPKDLRFFSDEISDLIQFELRERQRNLKRSELPQQELHLRLS